MCGWKASWGELFLDAGVASDYLLLGGMAVLSVCVMFKDAKRSHKKG